MITAANMRVYSSFVLRNQHEQRQYQHKWNMYWLAPLAMIFFVQNQNQDQLNECEGIDRAERMRGLYENKIRFFCAPEKIFEIFASHRDE
jgi:hypothetical protein